MLKCRLSALVPFAESYVGHASTFMVQVACMIVCKCGKVAAHTSCPTNAETPPKPPSIAGRGKSTLLREMCLRRGKKGMGYIEVCKFVLLHDVDQLSAILSS